MRAAWTCSSSSNVFVVVSFLLLLPLPPSLISSVQHARAQETNDEMEFSYRRGEENGPEQWGLIRRDWAACSWGRRQSPIRLYGVAAGRGHRRSGRLLRSYRPAAASLVNRGHDIMVRFDGEAGGVVLDGVAYRLRQMHWHSPSEHAIDGRRYDLELHMLHQSDKSGRFAVVAQLFDIGHRRDATLHMLEPYIERISNKRKGHEVEIDADVDPRWPIGGSSVYYTYTGSFTTPPCTEGVTWAVARKVRRALRQQVELLREAVHDGARRNARPLQDANGRGVGLYYGWPNV